MAMTRKVAQSEVELVIFRHGQTDWNAEGRIQGHLDVPLNEVGRQQARRLIEPLRRYQVETFLSSDLIRASETARIAAESLGLSVSTDPGLREIHLGKLQGLTREEIEAKFGHEFSDRLRHQPLTDADVIQLGSESGEQVVERSLKAILTFVESNPEYRKIGICSHGGVVRRLILHALQDDRFPPPTPNGVLYPFRLELEARKFRLVPHSPFF